MSGVRAYDPELIEFGMSLPGFAERANTISSLPSLGALTLAGLTPPEFEVAYHDVTDVDAIEHLPGCDLAAISFLTAQAPAAYRLADRYRAAGVPVVVGGLHVTALPDEAAAHADAVVIGEGEPVWATLLDDFKAGRLQSRYSAVGREWDLDGGPLPRYNLLEPDRYNRITVQTQRGCPWRCEFCASSILLTPKYKTKSVERVIAEVRAIKQVWSDPFIEFADDNTFVEREHSRALMEALAAEEVRWFTETDIGVADDPELLDLMREAGCAQVLIGLESPRESGMAGLETRRDWKRGRLPDYRDAIGRIQAAGITVNGCFVLGLDGDGPEVFDDIASFAEESGLVDVQVTVLTPFPGTPLYRRLKEEGRLLADGQWERFTLFDVTYEPLNMSVAQLKSGLRDLARRLYTPEAKRRRLRAFIAQARRGQGTRERKRSDVPKLVT